MGQGNLDIFDFAWECLYEMIHELSGSGGAEKKEQIYYR